MFAGQCGGGGTEGHHTLRSVKGVELNMFSY